MRQRALTILAFLIAVPLFADIPTSSLTGRVLAGEAAAEGVTVTLTSPALPQPRTTTTGKHGTYWAAALPPGVYDVTFSRAGLTTLTRRAVVELGRVARADAVLQPSDDEESITSTATTISVVETTDITSHFSDVTLERLPTGRDPLRVAQLAPGVTNKVILDGAFTLGSGDVGEELIEEITVFRGDVIHASTRSGGEDLFLALRATYRHLRDDDDLLLESASGGRIVPERLWFFGAGWTDGFLAKLTARPAASHELRAMILNTDETRIAAAHTGVFGAHVTTELVAAEDHSQGKLTWFRDAHVVTAGGGEDALFINDRWSTGAWIVSAGVRREDDRTAPRAAVAYDLRRNGRHAIFATYGDYARERRTTLGYAGAIGTSGIARADVVRRDERDELQLEARYGLFGRFDSGVSYTLAEGAAHSGTAWAGVQLPAGESEVALTLLERYEVAGWTTGAAVRYALPLSRFALTLAADAFHRPREVRLWARIGWSGGL